MSPARSEAWHCAQEQAMVLPVIQAGSKSNSESGRRAQKSGNCIVGMESATSLIHLSSRAMSEPRSCGEDKPRDLVFFSQSTQGVLNRFRNSSAVSPATRITFLRLVWPDAMVTDERGTF